MIVDPATIKVVDFILITAQWNGLANSETFISKSAEQNLCLQRSGNHPTDETHNHAEAQQISRPRNGIQPTNEQSVAQDYRFETIKPNAIP
jgi:hypothetical protein